MAKVTYNTTGSGYLSNTDIDANFAATATALENTLSRDGTSPNSMGADLDMNSNEILNLAQGSAPSSAARLKDITDAATITTTTAALTTYNQGGTGAADRTVKGKLQEFVSVKDFGAVGDGVTDDTTAFNNALATRLPVYVPATTSKYIVDGVALLEGSIIFGDGDLTVIDLKSSPSNSAIFEQTDVGNIEVHSLKLTNSSAAANVYGFFAYLTANTGKENINIHHCSFDGFTIHGVAVNGYDTTNAADAKAGYTGVKVNDCHFENITSTAFLPYGNIDDVQFCRNTSESGGSITFKADIFSKRVICTDNVVDGNLEAEGGCETIIMADNICGKLAAGFGTVSTSAGGSGKPHWPNVGQIVVNNICTNIEIVGHDSHTADTTPYTWGSRTYDDAKKFVVSGNICLNSTVEGMQLSRVRDGIITNNIIADATQYGMRVNSAIDCIISHNKAIDCGTATYNSYLIDGDATNKTLRCLFDKNYAFNDTAVKTAPEVQFTQYVDNCFVDTFIIDPGSTNISQTGLQYADSTNITPLGKTQFINEPSSARFAIGGSATFKDCPMQAVSERIDLSASDTYLLFLPDVLGRCGISDIDIVYEKQHTAGTQSTINVGSTNTNNRHYTGSSSTAGTQWEIVSPSISTASTQPAYAVVVNVSAGTTDAEVRVVVNYGEL